MPCQKLPSESCDGDRTDDDFILGEGLLKPMPICFPPGAVERIRHDLENDDVVMHRRSLGVMLPWAGARVKAVMPPNRRVNSSRTSAYLCAAKGRPSLSATGNRISTRCTVHLTAIVRNVTE
jgi:hypothetical protein